MLLHTIVSEYDIFGDAQNPQPTEFLNIAGGMLECKICDGKRQITRLHSTNPYLYLRNDYSPYTILK